MKKNFLTLAVLLILAVPSISQVAMKEYKAGHEFSVSLPDYMNKTIGLNGYSSIQFKSTVKDVYGFIIEDNKEELQLAEMKYSSLNEFYEEFIKDFVKDEEKRMVSKAQSKTIGAINFIEADVSFYDKDAQTELYYFTGIAETATAYYKVICWSSLENKDQVKADFEKILYSIKD